VNSVQTAKINTDDVSRSTRATVNKLSETAGRLKQLSELTALQQQEVQVSVDSRSLLESIKAEHAQEENFGDIRQMVELLTLLTMGRAENP